LLRAGEIIHIHRLVFGEFHAHFHMLDGNR
jgi:hypothetical protein